MKKRLDHQKIFWSAIKESFLKLNPVVQVKNPVMFVVFLGSILTSVIWIASLVTTLDTSSSFVLATTLTLWLTVLFSNFSEALAEGRGKAQAEFLKSAKQDVPATLLVTAQFEAERTPISSGQLKRGDLVLVEAGQVIPADGEILVGEASVDESAITGESAPVIREAGGDRSSVTGGTRVLSDQLIIRVESGPGESFLDRMIAMVEGANRKKTPNEIALNILLVALTVIFLGVTLTLFPFSSFTVAMTGTGKVVTITALVALLVCLIPTTIGALLSAIGIAGMNRLSRVNVLANSGRAVEAAGDVNVLLLDKTGTITFGNRQASEFLPAPGVTAADLAHSAYLASLADETPEGRSIVALAKHSFPLTPPPLTHQTHRLVPFTAQTRMSGLDLGSVHYRKGAWSAMKKWSEDLGYPTPREVQDLVDVVSRRGATPLVVGTDGKILGLVVLKDIVKEGIQERFAALRQMGIKTIMVTGDNSLTAAAIAAEAGVDDFLAEATPETKLELIRRYQSEGHLVAMTGDGTNDAPALAQADVAVAMNSGTQAAKEAGNMIDLDSSPTKLVDIVLVGKQMLMTRGALTTFSIANDIAKYFAILPAIFMATYSGLGALNIMHLATPESAILSAIIFNALIIPLLLPLALKGVQYTAQSASKLLSKNLLLYGLGGIISPFIGIKLIDILISGRF